MMTRLKGVTLAEIVEATGQTHAVREFVSILGRTGAEKIEASKNAWEAQLPHREGRQPKFPSNVASGSDRGGVAPFTQTR